MTNFKNSIAVSAQYTEQRVPAFRNNALIGALPPCMSDDDLVSTLTLMPDFDAEQRLWPTAERLHMLQQLQNFMVPMQNHVELARALDSMLRGGYVGRAPRTAGHAEIFQNIYRNQIAGVSFSQTANSRTPQISSALVGISGMGKTTAVKRWCAHLPPVIFHEEFNLYQIPVLHVEMPSDGSSAKGLAHGILQKIDELIPGAGYYERYAQRGKTGSDSLMRSVARVMNLHAVGLLICDEVQNMANARKGGQTAMTELVSMCNDLKVPILFIGTNKASKILSLDFRQARRSTGQGIAPWDRLHRGFNGQPGEWDDFLEVLWGCQWVRNPVPLSEGLSQMMYDGSQGVIDLAIKLFSAAQIRAMTDGSEIITPELLTHVYKSQFKMTHMMVHALRTDNVELLVEYDDIAPVNFEKHFNEAQLRQQLHKSPLVAVKSTDATYQPRLASALNAIGVNSEDANKMAKAASEGATPLNLLQGMKKSLETMSTPKPLIRAKRSKDVEELSSDRFDGRAADYRRAFAHAEFNQRKVLQQLQEFGMAPDLEELLEI